jgi:hypothetical protein
MQRPFEMLRFIIQQLMHDRNGYSSSPEPLAALRRRRSVRGHEGREKP